MKQLKFLFALAALCMAGSVCRAATNFTAVSAEGKTVEYTYNNGAVFVAASSATNQAIEGALTIPDAVEYNGSQYPVTQIGQEAFSGNTKLTSVAIGNNVETISEKSFQNCTNLATVTFGTSLVRINNYAFAGSGLNGDLVFPASLQYINQYTFSNTSIKSVRFQSNPTIQSYAFSNCNSMEAYYFAPCVFRPTIQNANALTVLANTKLYVSQATLAMLQNGWASGYVLQNTYNSAPGVFVAYESAEGSVFMHQVAMTNGEGTSVGSLALCFTVTSMDSNNPTAALYCPPATGYSADNVLKSGANTVIKNALTGDGKLVIPETVTDQSGNTYTVTVIGVGAFGEYASSYYTHITGLKIPSTITHIGVQAFRYLQYLSGNLIIPASVRQIGHPDVARADLFYSERNYSGTATVDGVYMMHTSASGIDWYETQANYYFAYNGNNETYTYLYVCQEIYDKAYGKNGATRYPTTSAFRSWLNSNYWNGGSHVALFNPATLGLAWSMAQTIVDISGEFEAPELLNPFQLPVIFSSSNPNVASIDEDGNIMLGTAEGSTTLTATFAGNEEYTTPVSVQTVVIRRGEPMLAEDQVNHNQYNTCEALTKVTRWLPNPDLYMENNMWEMPHMMDGKFYVSAFWQSNNDSDMSEWFRWNDITNNEKYLQLSYSPAFLSPNYGLYYNDGGTSGLAHDEQPGTTLGGFICFKVKGSGTIVVRGFTESDNAYMGICVQGNVSTTFSGTEEREVEYAYTLENADDEAYAYVYGVSLSPNGRHGYIRYIKFIPDGTVMADVSVGGVAIEEESDDVLGDGGSIGFEWREDEEGGDILEGSRRLEPAEEGASSTRYPVLILTNANLTSDNGPAIEVNSHDRFLIELHGENTIQTSNGNAAISMGTLQSEDWGGGTISIVGLEEGATLTIPAVEGVESGVYLAESSIHVENFVGDINGSDYGVRFQGYDSNDYESDANCNMTFGEGMLLKMRGGEAALSGFNPQSMYDLGYYDEEEEEWKSYALLESDLIYAQPLWSGVYGVEEENYIEDPDDPEGGQWEYRDIPAKYLYFGNEMTVTVSSYGWATYIPMFNAEFEEGDAWIVTAVDEEKGKVTLEAVNAVSSYTPVLLKGEGTKTIAVTNDYIDERDDNMLSIGTGEEYENNEYPYVLAKEGTGACFKQWTGAMSELKDRVVLVLDFAQQDGTRTLTLNEAGTQGISDNNRETITNNRYYDLQGRRVNHPTKGLYIVNGKKVNVK